MRLTSQSLLYSARDGSGQDTFQFLHKGTFQLQLADPTNAGNTLVMGFTARPFPSSSCTWNGNITDDKNNTWTIATSVQDSANTQFGFIAYALNVAANTHVVTFTEGNCGSSNTTQFGAIDAVEFQNISAFDAASSNTANGTSIQAGMLAPTVSGDLIFHYAFLSGNQVNAGFTHGSQPNITWTLGDASRLDGNAAQWGVYQSSSPFTPTMALGGNATSYVSLAAAFKASAAPQGSGLPSGIHVIRVFHDSFVKGSAATQLVQVPCSGNLLVAAITGHYTWKMNSMSDSNSNTWNSTGPQVTNNESGTQFFYATNPKCSDDLTATLSWNDTASGHGTVLFYDIGNAKTSSPLDVDTGVTGNQGNAGTITNAPTIAPTVPGDLVLAEAPVAFNTLNGCIGYSTMLFDASVYTGESVSGPEPVDQNNGWCHWIQADTSTVNVGWKEFYSSPGAGGWSARASAWKTGP